MPAQRYVPPALHDLETEIMDAVWELGETSVRQVMELLNGRAPKDRAYTTFMTVFHRLDEKGLLSRRRSGKTDHYTPTLTRDEYRQRRAEVEVRHLVSEYGDAALSEFAREMATFDPARRRALQRIARRA
jgi:predicted transcriptional regulator